MATAPEVARDPSIGTVVENPVQLGWGPGRIVGIKGRNVWVLFRDHPGREAKLMAADRLRPAASQEDPILDNLPEPRMENGRLMLAADRTLFEEAIRWFLVRYPEGFADTAYLGRGKDAERAPRWAAHERFQAELGNGELKRFVEGGHVKAAMTRIGEVIGTVSLLSRLERTAFLDALRSGEVAALFLSALTAVVEAPEPTEETFAPLLDAVAGLPTDAAVWTVATILPSLARPDAHLFLKPGVAQKAAQGLAFDLRYSGKPNWETYERALLLASIYREKLADLGQPNLAPRDLIDVQAFLASAGTNWEKAAARAEARKKQVVKKKA